MDIEVIKKIKELRAEGKSFQQIAFMLGNDLKATKIRYYAEFFDVNKYYEKLEYEKKVCEIIKHSTNLNQVCKELDKLSTNTNYGMIRKIIDKYDVDISHFNNKIKKVECKKEQIPFKEKLVENSKHRIKDLAKNLIKEGLKEHKCEKCGRVEWEGDLIPLEVHHINGNNMDNRIENLQMLCPNCHAQTDNYCVKNTNKNKVISKRICKYCGKEFESHSSLKFCCREHYRQWFKENNKPLSNGIESKCPKDKEILLNDFRELRSFTQVGKKYGVSDKAVFKWCERLGLPTHIKDIKEILKKC